MRRKHRYGFAVVSVEHLKVQGFLAVHHFRERTDHAHVAFAQQMAPRRAPPADHGDFRASEATPC